MALARAAVLILDEILEAALNATTFERLVNSEAVNAVAYNPLTQDLTIRFTGNNIGYQFKSVPADVVARFLTAPSKGSFYHEHIRDRYQAS